MMAAKRVKEPQETTSQALKRKADEAYQSGNIDRAVALLFTSLYQDLDDFEVMSQLFNIAKDYFDHDQFDKALAIFMPMNILELEIFTERDYSTFLAGMALVRLAEKELGESLMKKGMEDDETNPGFGISFGFYLLNENRLEEGIQVLKEFMDEIGGDDVSETVAIYESIAWAEFKLGHQKDALEYILDRSWDLTEDNFKRLFARFLRIADDKIVIDITQKILKEVSEQISTSQYSNIFSAESIALLEYGKRLQRLIGTEVPVAFIDIITKIQPENIEVKLALGKVQRELGAAEAALQLAQEALAIAPEDARAYALLSQVRLDQKDYQDALNAAEKGLSLIKNEEAQKTGDAQAQNRIDPFNKPDTEHLTASEIDPQAAALAELLLAKADALTNLEQFDAALQTVKEAQRLHPKQITFYNYAATLLLNQGELRAAQGEIAAARKAGLKLDPLAKKLARKIKAALAKDKET